MGLGAPVVARPAAAEVVQPAEGALDNTGSAEVGACRSRHRATTRSGQIDWVIVLGPLLTR
jgi:hypothetical protein